MYAIGRIAKTKSATGHYMAELLTISYCISNYNQIPMDAPEYGLFRFHPEDQFCTWVDLKTLDITH